MALAAAIGFSDSTIIPVLFEITTSGKPPTFETTTGLPAAPASNTATPKLSLLLNAT
jgi:hypothetical protein